MTKPIALSVSLSLLLQSAAALAAPLATPGTWSDTAVDASRGMRFEKAVLTSAPSTELGDGITVSPGVAKILQRVSGSGFTRVADKDDDVSPLLQFQGAMRSLTKKVSPTVVTILAKGKVKASEELSELDKLFEELQKAPKAGPQGTPKPLPKGTPSLPKGQAVPDSNADKIPEDTAMSTGSGVIVDNSDGKPLIVTNAHVVAIAGMNGTVKIFLKDEEDPEQGHEAQILGFNARYDLALVKFSQPCPSCQAAKLGDKDSVEDGDLVLAVGSPFGLPQTKTLGIVSYVNRNIGGDSLVDDFIQTDAAINRGNSGGPLFNVYGRLIAINTQIYSPTGGSVGLGFSIPVRHVIALIERYRRTGAVAASRLGLTIKQTPAGMVIAEADKDSVAAKAGFVVDDLIVSLDGVAAPKEMHGFLKAASDKVPGTAVKVTVQRGKKTVVGAVTAQAITEMKEPR